MSIRRSPEMDNDGPAKKKMRQGTHSCIECRRRKIKCIFQSERNGVCNECYARGVSCVDQESAAEAQTLETRQSLRERVANLESLIKVIAQKVDVEDLAGAVGATPIQTDQTNVTKQVVVTTSSDLAPSEAGYDRAPIMALFNNSMTTFETVPSNEPISLPAEAKSKDEKIRQKLLKHLPSDREIKLVWEKCSHWWTVWARMFPELKYASSDGPSYIKKGAGSESLLVLCKAILCLCLGLQQVDVKFAEQELKLSMPRDDLVQYYLSIIHDSIFSDDRYLTKMEGLEIGIMLAKMDANEGRPRKAWLTYRRAISFALLLGFNRKKTWQVTSADPISGPKRRAIFWALFSGDRYFSLILGLPYSLSDQQCDIAAMTESQEFSTISSKAMYELSNLGGRLIERYQNPDLVSLSTTMSYDRSLQELKKKLPSIERLNPRNSHTSFEDVYDGSLALMYYNYVRSLLHLPFALKFSDATFEYSRKTTLESAREMVQAYTYLREGAHGEYLNCRILDFQIFFVCLILAINAMAFEPFSPSGTDPAVIERDWDLVENVKKLLVSVDIGLTGSMTMRDPAIATLDQVLQCRYGCPEPEKDSTEISIPYFGKIVLTPRAEIKAALAQTRRDLLTPSQTLSSCGSPASQPSWQIPTPPISTAMSDAGSTKMNSYVAYDREFIPMPPPYNIDGDGNGNGDFAFTNSIYMNDMAGIQSYDWLSQPVSFNTDLGSGWFVNPQTAGGIGASSSNQQTNINQAPGAASFLK